MGDKVPVWEREQSDEINESFKHKKKFVTKHT